MVGFPKLFGIFEFRKKHEIRNIPKRLNMRFQAIKLNNEFLKERFHFLQTSRSFQGQGNFGGFQVKFGV